jgi:hypothetical protein
MQWFGRPAIEPAASSKSSEKLVVFGPVSPLSKQDAVVDGVAPEGCASSM